MTGKHWSLPSCGPLNCRLLQITVPKHDSGPPDPHTIRAAPRAPRWARIPGATVTLGIHLKLQPCSLYLTSISYMVDSMSMSSTSTWVISLRVIPCQLPWLEMFVIVVFGHSYAGAYRKPWLLSETDTFRAPGSKGLDLTSFLSHGKSWQVMAYT